MVESLHPVRERRESEAALNTARAHLIDALTHFIQLVTMMAVIPLFLFAVMLCIMMLRWAFK